MSDLSQVRQCLSNIINYRDADFVTDFNLNQRLNLVSAYSIDNPKGYQELAFENMCDLSGEALHTLITRDLPNTAEIHAKQINDRIFTAIEPRIREIEEELRHSYKYEREAA